MILLALACIRAPQPEVSEDLAEASEEVIFASVEEIGSHVFNSSILRETFHKEDKLSSHLESVEIIWSDWDNFSYRFVVNDEEALNVRVVSATPYKKKGGVWSIKRDAERYRIELRQHWNVWEQNTKPFQSTMIKRLGEREAIESRDSQIYTVELPQQPDSDGLLPKPISFDGKIWVDKKTAVRLKADVTGELGIQGGKKRFTLNIERSKIGHTLDIKVPSILSKKKEKLLKLPNRIRQQQ